MGIIFFLFIQGPQLCGVQGLFPIIPGGIWGNLCSAMNGTGAVSKAIIYGTTALPLELSLQLTIFNVLINL